MRKVSRGIVVALLSLLIGSVSAAAATLKLSSFPSGAQVSVDGVNTGKVTPIEHQPD